jgi:hypothetical protein
LNVLAGFVVPAFYERQLPISPDSDIYLALLGRVVQIKDVIAPCHLDSESLQQLVDSVDLLLECPNLL